MRRWLGARPLEDDVQRILTWVREEAGGLTHNILSATHTDTISGAVAQGDLMVGESTPRWARLALGADTYVLRSDGTDAGWADPAAYVPIAPTGQGSIIISDATPAWIELVHPGSAYQHLESDASTLAWQVNLTLADDAWIGLGAAAGRLIFDSTPAADEIRLANGVLDLAGIVDALVLDADGDTSISAPTDDQIDFEVAGADDFTITANALNVLSGSAIVMADDAWIGLGAAGGRIIFDSTPNPDQVQLAAADLYLPASHGIIHADGVVAGYVLRADGTRYVPADPTTTLPLAPVAQGDLIIADATPAWSILTLGAAAGYALVSTATTAAWNQTPIWTGLHTFNAGWLLGGGTADLDGVADALVLDADGNTSISAPTDDQIDIEVAGADDFTITANAFNVLAGSAIVMANGATVGQAAGPLLTFDDTNNYLEITGCSMGLGTATPGYQLHGYLNTNSTQAFTVENPNAGNAAIAAVIVKGDAGSGSLGFCSSVFAEAHRQDRAFVAAEATAAGLDIIALAASGSIVFYTGGTNTTDRRGIIESDGDWGIKTVTPVRTLDVNGTIYAAGSDAAWTTSVWGRSIEMEQGDAILWKKGAAGVARGIGASGNGVLYIARSTANDASAAAAYDVIVATDGDVGLGVTPATRLDVDGAITFRELSSDPAAPAEGSAVLWMGDGTGTGDDGDILMKITAGAVTKTVTLVDFSAI